MSIRSEIARIRNLRDAIRAKLLTWGLVGETANLEACKTAIEDIADHTNATVNGDFSSGETGFITGQITEKGYYNEASKLKIPVANFSEENIKKGVAMGGLVGKLDSVPEDINILMGKTADGTLSLQNIPFKPYGVLFIALSGGTGNVYILRDWKNHSSGANTDDTGAISSTSNSGGFYANVNAVIKTNSVEISQKNTDYRLSGPHVYVVLGI